MKSVFLQEHQSSGFSSAENSKFFQAFVGKVHGIPTEPAEPELEESAYDHHGDSTDPAVKPEDRQLPGGYKLRWLLATQPSKRLGFLSLRSQTKQVLGGCLERPNNSAFVISWLFINGKPKRAVARPGRTVLPSDRPCVRRMICKLTVDAALAFYQRFDQAGNRSAQRATARSVSGPRAGGLSITSP